MEKKQITIVINDDSINSIRDKIDELNKRGYIIHTFIADANGNVNCKYIVVMIYNYNKHTQAYP